MKLSRMSDKRALLRLSTLALLSASLALSLAHAQSAPADAPKAPVAPAPTPAVLPLFVVHLTTGPAWAKDIPPTQQAGFRAHSDNLARMRSENVLVMGARYKDKVADKGMLLIRAANIDAVRAQFDADPMVNAKLFVLDIAEFAPFYEGFVNRAPRPPSAIVTSRPATQLDALQWLAGCWAGSSGKMAFREHWMRQAGGMMMGMGYSIADGKLASFEAMRIELDITGDLAFVAKPSGQPEASFKMVKNDADGAVFENPAHDFPQRVRYQLKSDGSLHARIEGTKDGKTRGVDFPMRRVSCD
ncbi:MAG: hypothetical protein JNN20_07395 [Betaproteobacteria bacterium]|nr:hypothetical protein [Betaproteobacteria bacterium]